MSQLLHGEDLFIAVGSELFNIGEFVTGVNSKSIFFPYMYVLYVRVYAAKCIYAKCFACVCVKIVDVVRQVITSIV